GNPKRGKIRIGSAPSLARFLLRQPRSPQGLVTNSAFCGIDASFTYCRAWRFGVQAVDQCLEGVVLPDSHMLRFDPYLNVLLRSSSQRLCTGGLPACASNA